MGWPDSCRTQGHSADRRWRSQAAAHWPLAGKWGTGHQQPASACCPRPAATRRPCSASQRSAGPPAHTRRAAGARQLLQVEESLGARSRQAGVRASPCSRRRIRETPYGPGSRIPYTRTLGNGLLVGYTGRVSTRWWENFMRVGLRAKLLGGFVVVALCTGVLGVYALITMERLNESQLTMYVDVFGGTHLLATYSDDSWQSRSD